MDRTPNLTIPPRDRSIWRVGLGSSPILKICWIGFYVFFLTTFPLLILGAQYIRHKMAGPVDSLSIKLHFNHSHSYTNPPLKQKTTKISKSQ